MHRNIKLEDLLLRSSGHHDTAQICLGDFGHATAFIPGKLMKRPKNSPIYASPEEILVGEYDEKIDARRRRPARYLRIGTIFPARSTALRRSQVVAPKNNTRGATCSW